MCNESYYNTKCSGIPFALLNASVMVAAKLMEMHYRSKINSQTPNTEKSGDVPAAFEFAKVIPYNLRVLRGDIPIMKTVEDVELADVTCRQMN